LLCPEVGVALSGTAGGRLAQVLDANRAAILSRWVELAGSSLRRRLTTAELEREFGDLLDALPPALDTGLAAEEAGELRALLAELSASRARRGFSSTETAAAVFALKDAILDRLDVSGGDAQTLADFVVFDKIIDQMGLLTFETYAVTRERLVASQAEQLLELSTPVVKLWEGVVAVPLVGTLDSARAQVVMEKLLQSLVDTGSAYAIIDITGVPAVDTQVAQHILKTVVAARLMGADCLISGIRPQIAQTIVALGIEFGDITTKATLADALRHAVRASGAETARRAGRQEA
jgi:rsbT co-antagonist protein RsbR